MRQSNAIDFWRGFVLVHILVGHIPDNGFWRITLKQFSWSDGAEALVFLAGLALGLRLAARPQDATSFIIPRLIGIYAAHVIVSLVLVILYAETFMRLGDENILRDNAIDPVMFADGSGVVGTLLMLTHVRYFDILSLYFVLTVSVPIIVALARVSTPALLAFSALLYILAQAGVAPRQWPSDAPWAFNPFAWQFIFVAGFVVASAREQVVARIARTPAIAVTAFALVIACVVLIRLDVPSYAMANRTVLEDYLWGKDNAGILRIVQFAALCVVAFHFSPAVAKLFPLAWRLGSLLGRNSLLVFSASGALSAIGQIAHRQGFHGVLFDTAFTSGAVALMLACAWMREQQQERRKESARGRRSFLRAPVEISRVILRHSRVFLRQVVVRRMIGRQGHDAAAPAAHHGPYERRGQKRWPYDPDSPVQGDIEHARIS